MIDVPTILIPDVKEDERLRPAFNEEIYRQQKERWNPPFVIDTIHFVAPDHFLHRHLSMRAARDWQHHPFWFYVAVLFFVSQLVFIGIGVGFKLFAPYIPYLPRLT